MWEPRNKQQLIQDHQNRVSLKTLVQTYGGTNDKIRGFLQREGQWVPYKVGRTNLPEQEVIELYQNDVPVDVIADKFFVSVSPVIKILEDHKVRKPVWAKDIPYNVYMQLDNKEHFARIFEKLVSKRRVAEHFGVGLDMITSLMKRYQIAPLSSGMVRSIRNRKQRAQIPLTKKAFIEEHFSHNKSLQDIATEMGISTGFLRQHVNRWDIKCRDTRISLEFRKFKQQSISQIQKLVSDTPITVLYKKYNVSYQLFREFLDDVGISVPQRFISTGEKAVGDFLKSHGIVIECNNRHLIHPYEIDIYVPSHRVAVEYCGLYWHSELNGKDRNYHLTKHNRCEQKGIRLITIFEDEYIDKSDLVHSKLLSILGLSTNLEKINARDCEIREITSSEKRDFLKANHIQGDDKSTIKLGLLHNNSLVAVMTFAKPSRVRTSIHTQNIKGLWELNRFAVDTTKNVRGAAGKLLSHFVRNYEWKTVYSYADKRWSNGNLYRLLGFEKVSDTPPNYWYVPRGYYKRIYRYQFTKYKLVEEGFDKDKSESQIMKERGYTKIWDCGHHKYEIYNV